MFIQTEATPNPDTLKFLPGRDLAADGPLEFLSAEAAQESPLARRLFQLEGVAGVFFGRDFLTVSRRGGLDWAGLKAPILAAIMDWAVAGEPLVDQALSRSEAARVAVDDANEESSQIVREIRDLLDSRIRPAVAQDGGDIEFDRFDAESGVVHLRMRGACAGCPSSAATLKAGVENLLRHYVPEVTRVEQIA